MGFLTTRFLALANIEHIVHFAPVSVKNNAPRFVFHPPRAQSAPQSPAFSKRLRNSAGPIPVAALNRTEKWCRSA
ncbi:MAG: hypothetical protein RLZZ50_902 [Verrucomicrobiota bacterium]